MPSASTSWLQSFYLLEMALGFYKATGVALSAAFALLVVGCGSDAGNARERAAEQSPGGLQPIPWPEGVGPSTITANNGGAWAISFRPAGENGWMITERGPVAIPASEHFATIVPDEDAVWAVEVDGGLRPAEIVRIPVDELGKAIQYPVPSECAALGGRSVVFQKDLWIDCSDGVVHVKAGEINSGKFRHLPELVALLPAGDRLLAIDTFQISCIAGKCEGTKIGLPEGFLSINDTSRQAGWITDGRVAVGIGIDKDGRPTGVRIDLSTGDASSWKLPEIDLVRAEIHRIRSEVWLTDPGNLRILRYGLADLTRPPDALTLPAAWRSPDTVIELASAARTVWVSVRDPERFHLFRFVG